MDYELTITKKQKKFNNWFYSKMKPGLFGDILEIGSGIGTFSEKIIRDFKNGKIYLSEIDPKFLKLLKKQFKNQAKVLKIDLNNKKDFEKIKKKFDSILMPNVLEHVKDDVLALRLLRDTLKDRGHLVIYVPCHKFLFCDLDVAEGHYRRYSGKEIEAKARKAGFKIKKAFWFNLFGIPARFVAGNLLKNDKSPPKSLSLFNNLVPVFRFVEEKILLNCAGVGKILILEK